MKVNVYSTPSCMYCIMVKDFFAAKGVEYSEFNVAEDAEKRNYIIEKTGQMGVPVIEIVKEEAAEGEFITGFDEDSLSEKLDLN